MNKVTNVTNCIKIISAVVLCEAKINKKHPNYFEKYMKPHRKCVFCFVVNEIICKAVEEDRRKRLKRRRLQLEPRDNDGTN